MRVMTASARDMSTERMFKNFGITWKEVSVCFKDGAPDKIFTNFFMPAKVVAEYKKYLILEIQPHYNPYVSQGISRPYRICANKTRIWLGDVVVKLNNKIIKQ